MLTDLNIKNIVLIDALALQMADGLTTLTGETGAGKSILLDALGLAIGKRAEAGLVRRGTDMGSVTAVFDLPDGHAALKFLERADIVAEGEVILRRTIGSDGRSKAYINDTPVSITMLKQLGAYLVEIHGQFDTAGLLNEKNHRSALDAFGGYQDLQKETATHYKTWHEEKETLSGLRDKAGAAAAREDYLRYCLAELEKLNPEKDEAERLGTLRSRLMNREKLADTHQQLEHLFEGDDGIYNLIGQAEAQVEKLDSTLPETGGKIRQALERARLEIEDAAGYLNQMANADDEDMDLDAVEERLFALKDCARKHNCDISELPEKKAEIADEINLIDDFEAQLNRLENAVHAARKDFIQVAKNLHSQRTEAAKQLGARLMQELPALKLDRARFEINVTEQPEERWSRHGMDHVAFQVATNPGAAPGPINKIASGGELSRFMLALKLVLAETSHIPTLIFDEVDSGVGGATADAVGRRLEQLSQYNQILVVTHSAQVAARGARQLRISKTSDDKNTVTGVTILDDDARLDEIARMIAGAEVTSEARAAAKKLIADKAA